MRVPLAADVVERLLDGADHLIVRVERRSTHEAGVDDAVVAHEGRLRVLRRPAIPYGAFTTRWILSLSSRE